ncbi:hypothetical protein [Winogradskyella psychrotolerans]|uniref:hypothetical protein n=1 Tax=Winogradskyella psychrotolerans TaxID=1344585 RepID=UPI00339D4427
MKKTLSSNTIIHQNSLKFELIEFCKKNQLLTYGSKIELEKRITAFLNGQIEKDKSIPSLKCKRRIIKKVI